MGMSILEAMMGDMNLNTGDDWSITDEQAITQLREILEQIDEVHTFKRGDIIVHKFPANSTMADAGSPHVFLGYLDEPVRGIDFCNDARDASSNSAARIFDCRIGLMQREGFLTYLMSSNEFRPHPNG